MEPELAFWSKFASARAAHVLFGASVTTVRLFFFVIGRVLTRPLYVSYQEEPNPSPSFVFLLLHALSDRLEFRGFTYFSDRNFKCYRKIKIRLRIR